MVKKFFKMLGMLVLAALAAGGGWWLTWWSFDEIHEMRQLERVPQTEIMAVIPGEVNIKGKVVFQKDVLTSPDTKTRCVYYRYHVERYETDSDGDGSWVTVSDTRKFTPFGLKDATGVIDVVPSGRVTFNVFQSHRRRNGDMRYTEYRLDENAQMFLFGYAAEKADKFVVGFDTQASYRPLISQRGELAEREGMSKTSLITSWLGILLLALAVWFLFGAFRLHNTSLYLGAVTFVICTVLVYLSFAMVERDLHDAQVRAERNTTYATQAYERSLKKSGVKWDGDWTKIGSLEDKRYGKLDKGQRERLARIRIDLAQTIDRANQHQRRFPEVIIAPVLGFKRFEPLPLPDKDLAIARALDEGRAEAKLSLLWSLIGLALGGAMAFFGARWGFRKIKIKRTCENLPTSTVTGVSCGLTEINGRAELMPGTSALSSPVTSKDCVYYTYVITETRDKKTYTVHSETVGIPFLCRDATGAMPVDQTAATVITVNFASRSSGNRTYKETRIDVGDPLYVLATAAIDPDTHQSLRLGKSEHDEPFIIANIPENEVQYRLGRTGCLGLNLGMNGAVLLGMSTLGVMHSFGALDYLASAAVACAYLILCLVFLLYNDLVFVRRRVLRSWANIDVALKKRFDLINQLQPVIAAYAKHEQGLQAELAALRGQQQAGQLIDPASSTQIVAQQNQVVGGFRALREAYPGLKADEMFTTLMQTLTFVEDEIALMRTGYNDSVERYNTRIGQVPEVFLAKALSFNPHLPFVAQAEAAGVSFEMDEASVPA